MKKLLAAIVAFAMVLSLAAVVPAMAETRDGEMNAVFTAETVTAAPGETVTVTASIDGVYEIHGMTMEFNYDPAVLHCDSYALGPVLANLPQSAMAMPDNSIAGSFRMGLMCAVDGVTATGDLFTCTFTVAEDAQPGTYDIEFVITGLTYMPIGEPATDIPYELNNGAVVVEGEEPPTEEPPTEEPPTEEPPTEEPPTEEPPTEVPPTEEPTDQPTPPPTGAITVIGLGVAAIAAAAGVVIFRKKED